MARAKRQRVHGHPIDQPTAITPIEYGGLQVAYDHFNEILFGGALVDTFITYQRHAHSYGYFSPDRFAGRTAVGGRHELALNPDHFIGRIDEQITSTLVHEMVHVWQQQHGKPAAHGPQRATRRNTRPPARRARACWLVSRERSYEHEPSRAIRTRC
jgi:hypothetical protein